MHMLSIVLFCINIHAHVQNKYASGHLGILAHCILIMVIISDLLFIYVLKILRKLVLLEAHKVVITFIHLAVGV